MKAENATFGISFAGSGGAGAITANKHGYSQINKYGMRSVDEGVTAINEGCNVLLALWIKKSRRAPGAGAWQRNTAPDYERAIHHHAEQRKATPKTRLCRCAEPCSVGGDERVAVSYCVLSHRDARIVQAHESVRKSVLFLLFFAPGTTYHKGGVDVTVNVTAINLDRVGFRQRKR